ncbi:MAG: MgtC/SapB family protein [Lachnospiraceae bacterium]|nr:MgtC/SapB family protein [Lachnospiraceae bacterium]
MRNAGTLNKGGSFLEEYIPEILKEINIVSITVRLLFSLLCGGILGVERGRKKRPAGFRTYMLVCMGSTLVMITNQYIMELYGGVDPARMGAQVISGIGFLGAGTIIVTGRNRVKGLTTAAGLWAAACVGLSLGIGFYSGALIGCFLIFLVMAALHRLDDWVMASTKVINLYIEFEQMSDVGKFIGFAKEQGFRVSDLEITRANGMSEAGVGVLCSLRLPKKKPHAEILKMLSEIERVRYVEEL